MKNLTPSHINWSQLPVDFIVDDKYRIVRPLLSGSGGSVYLVKEVNPNQSSGNHGFHLALRDTKSESFSRPHSSHSKSSHQNMK